MSRVAWELYDPQTLETYVWPVNPHTDSGSHNISRDTKYEVQAGLRQSAGDDRIDAIVAYSADQPSKFSYEGYTYTKEQLIALETWAAKDYDVILKDDLGRDFRVIIEGLKLDRVRATNKPFKHSYTFSGIILEEL